MLDVGDLRGWFFQETVNVVSKNDVVVGARPELQVI
jgi:hypothetical protein